MYADRWQAGAALMQAANPQAWDDMALDWKVINGNARQYPRRLRLLEGVREDRQAARAYLKTWPQYSGTLDCGAAASLTHNQTA